MPDYDIAIIDFEVGNLLSVKRAFEKFDAKTIVTSDIKSIEKAKKIVLPGVGAFGNAMETLKKLDLISIIKDLNQNHVPILGICLGMQLLFNQSFEFGDNQGLGILSGIVKKIPNKNLMNETIKIPHIGWNELEFAENNSNFRNSIFKEIQNGDAMYFVHSYMVIPASEAINVAYCDLGGHKIPAIVERENVIGCQFHPEKSGNLGLSIIKNFIEQEFPS